MGSKINIYVPEDIRKRIDSYNGKNPYNPLNLSKIAQHAWIEELNRLEKV